MVGRKWPATPINEIEQACLGWPGAAVTRAHLGLLLLRIRIERVAAGIPGTVLKDGVGGGNVARRLMIWVGEPGLDAKAQDERYGVVRRSIAAYKLLSDISHGRMRDPFLPAASLDNLQAIVRDLEDALNRESGK